MESVVIELNQSHLKDLKTFFDETQNLKNILGNTLDKLSEMSKTVLENNQKLEGHSTRHDIMNKNLIKLRSSIDQVDKELEK